MNTHKVNFENDEIKADLLVSEETVLQGMRRTRLKAEASIRNEEDPDKAFLAIVTFPDLLSVTTGTLKVKGQKEVIQVHKLEFEHFLTLPGHLEAVWEKVVYELNPHFLPNQESEEEEKKRLLTSTDDSQK